MLTRSRSAPTTARDENALELNEGLAEYTGYRLGGEPHPQVAVAADLRNAESADSFVRSFAYHSGPAYGLLLDRLSPHWREHLNASADLAVLLATAAGITSPAKPDVAATNALVRYAGTEVAAAEQTRDRAHRDQIAGWQAQLIDGPVLVLPFVAMKIQFNPNNLLVVPAQGTVYPTLRVSDRWGVLDVDDGALIDANWQHVQVAAPTDTQGHPLQGKGWRLLLEPGWTIVPSKRPGDYTLQDTAAVKKASD